MFDCLDRKMTNEVRVFLFPSGKSPDRQYRKKDGLNSASAKRLQNVRYLDRHRTKYIACFDSTHPIRHTVHVTRR